MKLAPLLAQFLYANKRLDLPGIGSFMLDPASIIEQDNSKTGKTGITGGISFENDPTIRDANSLILYISSQTGKMKALAAADLDSYMQLALQFLNIGKPFLFEGIGSLVKVKSGQYAFAPNEASQERLKEYTAREISATSSTEESFGTKEREKINWRKPVIFLLIILGLGLGIWGGYTMYKNIKNKKGAPVEEAASVPIDTNTTADTSTAQIPAKQTLSEGTYKFVVEVAPKERGILRFSTLKSWGLNVKMEAIDSQQYKLYFVLPSEASDTSRVLDSLSALYTPAWSKGFVEN